MSSKRTKRAATKGLGDLLLHGPADEHLHKYLGMRDLSRVRAVNKRTNKKTPDCREDCDCHRPPHNVKDPRKSMACAGACTSICPAVIKRDYLEALGEVSWPRIHELVRLGADINLFFDTASALHVAIDQANVEQVRWCLDNGADAYIRSEVGENAFDILAGVQDVATAEVLLAHDTRQLPWQWYVAFVMAIHGDNTNEAFIDVVSGFVEEE